MSYDFDTLGIQAGYRASEHNCVVSVLICQTTAFALGGSYRADRLLSFSGSGSIYAEFSNLTVDVLEKRAAALHGVSDATALTLDMVAVPYTLLSTAGKGGRVLTAVRLYGGTVDSLGHLSLKLGVKIDFVESPGRVEELEGKLALDIEAVLIENLTDPFVTTPGFEVIARTVHAYEILLIVDSTVAIPYPFNLLEHGTDIVVYSAIKALSNHENVITGLVLESETPDYGSGNYLHFEKPLWFLRDRHDKLCSILQVSSQNPFTGRLRVIHLNYLGAALSPFNAYLVLIGLETLSERVAKQVSNTLAALEYLEQDGHILWVRYPCAQGSKYHTLADRYFPKGAGSILFFGFRGTEERKRAFLTFVKMFSYQANIDDARSLIINPAQITYIGPTEE